MKMRMRGARSGAAVPNRCVRRCYVAKRTAVWYHEERHSAGPVSRSGAVSAGGKRKPGRKVPVARVVPASRVAARTAYELGRLRGTAEQQQVAVRQRVAARGEPRNVRSSESGRRGVAVVGQQSVVVVGARKGEEGNGT